jgi:hypothetical protein
VTPLLRYLAGATLYAVAVAVLGWPERERLAAAALLLGLGAFSLGRERARLRELGSRAPAALALGEAIEHAIADAAPGERFAMVPAVLAVAALWAIVAPARSGGGRAAALGALAASALALSR